MNNRMGPSIVDVLADNESESPRPQEPPSPNVLIPIRCTPKTEAPPNIHRQRVVESKVETLRSLLSEERASTGPNMIARLKLKKALLHISQ